METFIEQIAGLWQFFSSLPPVARVLIAFLGPSTVMNIYGINDARENGFGVAEIISLYFFSDLIILLYMYFFPALMLRKTHLSRKFILRFTEKVERKLEQFIGAFGIRVAISYLAYVQSIYTAALVTSGLSIRWFQACILLLIGDMLWFLTLLGIQIGVLPLTLEQRADIFVNTLIVWMISIILSLVVRVAIDRVIKRGATD